MVTGYVKVGDSVLVWAEAERSADSRLDALGRAALAGLIDGVAVAHASCEAEFCQTCADLRVALAWSIGEHRACLDRIYGKAV
ncbi:hypothetical protein GCM10010109_86050 [Actinoplanes campanulatus]|nr:hypothetical protein GCM10010109_86050 [Actinoplanes campanulatus]GID41679.1 hypothetical protein Aca09nite_81850 [Actinoplanes campanulatus]